MKNNFKIFKKLLIKYFYYLAEFGDFNPREHSQTFVSEFRYHPMQDRQMELAILRHWSSGGQMQGFSPSQAEMAFLEKARQLPLYGVDLVS